jgi:hypothetical protein
VLVLTAVMGNARFQISGALVLTAVMGNIRITPAKPCVLTVVMENVRHRAVRAARLKQPDVDTAFAAIAVLTSLGFASALGLSTRSSSADG